VSYGFASKFKKPPSRNKPNESENITIELQKLYRSLEAGSITEEEFEVRESNLLDRLDSIEGIDSEEANDEDAGTVIQVMGGVGGDEEEHEQEVEDEHSTKATVEDRG